MRLLWARGPEKHRRHSRFRSGRTALTKTVVAGRLRFAVRESAGTCATARISASHSATRGGLALRALRTRTLYLVVRSVLAIGYFAASLWALAFRDTTADFGIVRSEEH